MRSAMCVRRYYQAYEKRNLHETQLSCRNATLTFSAKLISYDRRSLQRSPSTTKIRKTVIYDVGCAGLDFRESNARISLKRSRTLFLKKSSSIQLRTSPTKFLMKRGETGGQGGSIHELHPLSGVLAQRSVARANRTPAPTASGSTSGSS